MLQESYLKQASLLAFIFHQSLGRCAGDLDPRLENGLGRTPQMGWNTYNHYSCSPNEAIVRSNAQALVDLGLSKKGYHYVTVDCGWTLPNRTANGTLTWNPALFPSGYPALGQFIHGLGLGFGVYSDGGIQMCMTGQPTQAGSLFHEQTDANTFASWGADAVKYDNCFSDAATGYPNTQYTPSVSPRAHFKTMSDAVLSTGRPMLFQVCEWGVDFPAAWAPAMGNSWRATNDINPYYSSIPRILNQVVPQTSFAGPGHWLDLDMLFVGDGRFTLPEEQTHFSLWAIIKSPLIIGAALKDTSKSINAASLAILGNVDVISYNQDSLGVAASFTRRWTEEGYELWSGPLSGGKTVAALINLSNKARTLTLNLPDVGIQKAGLVKDIWNGVTVNNVATSYTAAVGAHGTILLELSQTTASGLYDSSHAVSTGQSTTFTNLYGHTSSSNYSATVTFQASPKSRTVTIGSKVHNLAASSTSLSIPQLTLSQGTGNNLTITPAISASSLSIAPPQGSFYPATTFVPTGGAKMVTCSTGFCAPVGSKIGDISPTGSAFADINSAAGVTGPKLVTIYFCQNDVAFASSFSTGTNTRNMTITVNGNTTRIELPLSGKSSELFGTQGWQDTGVYELLLDNWILGINKVVIGNSAGGLVSWGADFVGMSILW